MSFDALEPRALIPGGAHTYSKGNDQFPANAPRWIERGVNGHVWDESEREYIDWAMGLRAVSLGYGVAPVIEAATRQMWKGSNFSRASRIEAEYAAELIDLIPCAEMVKFAKNGSTVTSAAVKLARAFTGRDYVAFCKEHPFFSYDDWFIGTTPCNAGVPSAISDLSLPFHYNDIASLERQFDSHPGQIACVIMEATTGDAPQNDFLHKVQALCRKHGALFILDEMITGFRYHLQGAQAYFGLEPDMATFGKGLGNGFAVAALVGRRDVLDLGGIDHGAKRVFLISTTHGAENHALAAGQATLKIFREQPVIDTLWRIGGLLTNGLNEQARHAGIADQFHVGGYACYPVYTCRDGNGQASLPFKTLFMQEMIRHGVIMPYISPCFTHTEEDVERTVAAAAKAFAVYRQALDEGIDKHLVGPAVKPVFRPYN